MTKAECDEMKAMTEMAKVAAELACNSTGELFSADAKWKGTGAMRCAIDAAWSAALAMREALRAVEYALDEMKIDEATPDGEDNENKGNEED